MNLFSVHGALAGVLPNDRTPYFARNADEERALRDLERAGFVQRDSIELGWRWRGKHAASDRTLLALLKRFDLHLELGLAVDETIWIAAAIQRGAAPEERDAFSGTGFGPDDAVRACLGEFAEFQSWLYRPGDGTRRCEARTLGEDAVDPWSVLGFAIGQRDQRAAYNAAWSGYDSIPAPDLFRGEIDWAEIKSLSGQPARWLPAQICFGRYMATGVDRAWRSDSNGCAAGPTQQRALVRALLELIERDATGIWWYGGMPRPSVEPASVDADTLGLALAVRNRLGHRVRLLDLGHDLEIPVVAAILEGDHGQLLGLGFGCAIDKEQAIRSAYREMCQMELSIAFAKRRMAREDVASRIEDRRVLEWLEHAATLSHLRPSDEMSAGRSSAIASDDAESAALILERLRRAGLEAFSLPLQRPDIGVPAVRAFVPGLCHFKPRLGFRRLVEVPRALKWCDEDFSFEKLSALPLLI
jgi:ribosomal protein S12 methylthiotransferase accessory factor